jgi:hypothetical protein
MSENINFVPKEINPPSISQARPIEYFRGDLIQKVYENSWETKSERQLKQRIKINIISFCVSISFQGHS